MTKRTLSMALALTAVLAAPLAFAQVPVQTAAPDLAKAKQISQQICVACHAADGNSVMVVNPKIAGQHYDYLYKQLRNFKAWDGKPAERLSPVMNGIVAPLSDADMKSLAAYFSQQKLNAEFAKNKQTVALGQRIWRAGDTNKGLPACAGCHGPAGSGMPAQYPRLSGQFAEYTEAQLRLFRSEERANDANKVMRGIAVKMTDPEIKAVADYIAGLR